MELFSRFQKANISLITGWKNENNNRFYFIYFRQFLVINNYIRRGWNCFKVMGEKKRKQLKNILIGCIVLVVGSYHPRNRTNDLEAFLIGIEKTLFVCGVFGVIADSPCQKGFLIFDGKQKCRRWEN